MINLDTEYVLKNGRSLAIPGAPLFVIPIAMGSKIDTQEEVVRIEWQTNKSAWLPAETFDELYEEL